MTIFREVERNFRADGALPKTHVGNFGQAAQLQPRKRRTVQRKLIRHPDLRKSIAAEIKLGRTSGQTGNRMIHGGAERRVCRDRLRQRVRQPAPPSGRDRPGGAILRSVPALADGNGRDRHPARGKAAAGDTRHPGSR